MDRRHRSYRDALGAMAVSVVVHGVLASQVTLPQPGRHATELGALHLEVVARPTPERTPEPAPTDVATPTPGGDAERREAADGDATTAPRPVEATPTPTPAPKQDVEPRRRRFVRTDDLDDGDEAGRDLSDRNQVAEELLRAQVTELEAGTNAPALLAQVGTSVSPGLPRPLRDPRDTRGTAMDAKRATTDADAGGRASGEGIVSDGRPARATLSEAEPQPAGAALSRHELPDTRRAAPTDGGATTPRTPSSPAQAPPVPGLAGRPVSATAPEDRVGTKDAPEGDDPGSETTDPWTVPTSTQDPWWRPTVRRVRVAPRPRTIATLSRPSTAQPSVPTEGDRTASPTREPDRRASEPMPAEHRAPLPSAPPPREGPLDHDPVPDEAKTRPNLDDPQEEAAPAPASPRDQSEDGTVDAVRELQEALGWGRTEADARAPRRADAGSQGSPAQQAASSQAVHADARIAGQVALSTRATPLGRWLRDVDGVIREAFFARDLPPEERALIVEGAVTVEFRVDRRGRVSDLRLHESSGRPSLDTLGLASIPDRLPRMPRDVDATSVRHRLTLRYRAGAVQEAAE